VRAAASALDKAVKRGGIHKNAAARKKSRLARRSAKTI
jgi:ribosomal protein S20